MLDFFDHVDLEFGVGACVGGELRLSGSVISMTLR